MSSYAERHFSVAVISYPVCNGNSVSFQRVSNRELKVERIHCLCVIILGQRKHRAAAVEVLRSELQIAGEAMLSDFVLLAVDGRFAVL